MTAVYVDSSALVKLVVAERESAALEVALHEHDEWLSAIIAATEVLRTTHRWAATAGLKGRAAAKVLDRAERLVHSLGLIDVDLGVSLRAGLLKPVELRSLDSIHLATAIDLAEDLDGFVTYDLRLAAGARAAGLRVFSPG